MLTALKRVSISPMSQSKASGFSLNSDRALLEASVDRSSDMNKMVAFRWASTLRGSSPTTTTSFSASLFTLLATSKGLKPAWTQACCQSLISFYSSSYQISPEWHLTQDMQPTCKLHYITLQLFSPSRRLECKQIHGPAPFEAWTLSCCKDANGFCGHLFVASYRAIGFSRQPGTRPIPTSHTEYS